MFMWLAKSKQNKAIGKAAVVPTSFGVNEPILFGAPLILNPVFFIPFILTPIVNVWIFKAFVDILGMNSFMYFLPWTTPGPIGLILGTGIAPLAILLAVVLVVVDVLIYYPFFKVYDKEILEKELLEAEEGTTQEPVREEVVVTPTETQKQVNTEIKATNVLVLCAGGGTSRQLANSLNKGAEESGLPVQASGETYGAHSALLPNYDLVILAPQVASNYDDIKKETDREGVELIKTAGMEYIKLTQNPTGAVEFVLGVLNKDIDTPSIDETETEKEIVQEQSDKPVQNEMEKTNVLVLCAGGGTSRQLANALNKGAEESGLPLEANGETYGAHSALLPNYDLVILAPQVASNYEDIKKETDREGVKLIKTDGMEYINLTRDPKGATDFVLEVLDKK